MPLSSSLVDAVLERLGLATRPEPDLSGLERLNEAFVSRVPFDNVRKRIHLASGASGPLPGDDPAVFLESWLRDGAGGTCWPLAGAFHALLAATGFRAERAISTMMVGAGDLPPNHGTVIVRLDGEIWLVDPVMKAHRPLRLDAQQSTAVDHAARGLRSAPSNGTWTITWWPLHVEGSLDCRIDQLGASAESFGSLHQATRGWSPFNFALYVRAVRGDTTEGICFGRRARLDARGERASEPIDEDERRRYLVDVLGLSEALVSRLPHDEPTPPPPGSRSAAAAGPPAAA